LGLGQLLFCHAFGFFGLFISNIVQ
jgi:hypothetical protein